VSGAYVVAKQKSDGQDTGELKMDNFDFLMHHCEIPKMIKVKQRFPRPIITDIPAALILEMRKKGILDRVKAGDRVAITVGSRGIANIVVIVRETVTLLKGVGACPFILPAMGSHGGATAAGQIGVLKSLGITEESVGAPIKSSMEVVPLGATAIGLPVYMDRHGFEDADAIVVIARIRPHTSFRGRYESGFAKMIVVGLGKQVGAEACHASGFTDMSAKLEAMARLAMSKSNIVFGIGLIENAFNETCRIIACGREEILDAEPALLQEAYANMPRILFNKYDVLIVDEIGKNISGTGMDPSIIGRSAIPDASPCVQRVVALDLTTETQGNANGIGLADICTQRLFQKIDFQRTYPNPLTSRKVESVKIPMVMNTDRQAILAAVKTSFNVNNQNIRMIRIKNTLSLGEIYISKAMLDEARRNPDIEILEKPKNIAFDEGGNLTFLG
jgi:antitoxin (DNA-binding transcriptional repressor) of toxin-antitoxin stability system